jgi:tRNA (guanine-N7-)-methyltransferase
LSVEPRAARVPAFFAVQPPAPDSQPVTPAAAEWAPANIFQRAAPADIFPERAGAPLEVDIGCGEGAFLFGMAQAHPERNFLGIERLLGRVRDVCHKAARLRLGNLRVLRLESAWAVKHLLPLEAFTAAHVLFPDPWPKRHHQRRRLIQDEFLRDVRALLLRGGELRIKTDDLPYFQWIEKVLARAEGFERLEWEDAAAYPTTNFERRFIAQGLPIYRARLRKA